MSMPADDSRPRRAVFFDVNSFSLEGFTNGATIQYREILLRLQAMGWQCAVVTVGQSEFSSWHSSSRPAFERIWHLSSGIAVGEYLLDCPPVAAAERYADAIVRMVTEMSATLVIVNTPPARLEEEEVVLFETLAGETADRLCFVPDSLFPRERTCPADRYRRFVTALESFRLVAPSRFIAGQVEAEGLGPCGLFPNLFSPHRLIAERRAPEAITFVNPHPMKGLAVFEAVARRLPDRRFLAVRSWPYPPVYQTTLPNVTVVPFSPDMRPVWSLTAVLMVPSLCQEGFGRVVVEAQLNGIPVVAHRIGGLGEAAGEGGADLIDPPALFGDPECPELAPEALNAAADRFCVRIEALLTDAGRRAALIAAGKASAAATVAWGDRTVAALLERYPPSPASAHRPLLIVSPHADDAAFSVGGLIALGPRAGAIVTVFGRSNYTLAGGFSETVESVTRRRRAEEEEFARRAGLSLVYWEEPEAALRWGPDFERIFIAGGEEGAALVEDQACRDQIRDRLTALIHRLRPALVLLPGAIGGHRDHLVVRVAGQDAARAEGVPVAWYEDLPYAAEFDEDSLSAAMRAVRPDAVATILPIPAVLEVKLTALAGYASQVDVSTLSALRGFAPGRAGPAERLWSTAPIAPLLAGMFR